MRLLISLVLNCLTITVLQNRNGIHISTAVVVKSVRVYPSDHSVNQNTALPISIGSPKRTGISTVKCASIWLPPNITYCHTPFRPAFCPFCLGDKRPGVSAATRWSSWTREAELRDHLRAHLVGMHWPSKCPHALCTLEIGNPLSFLYHLGDVHGLNTNEQQQSRLTSASLDWIP